MASPFPHHYDVNLLAGSHASGVLTAADRPSILGGAPPEFDGRAEWWSPEHLLLSSVGLCLMTTFQALAGRARVPVARYESQVLGTLDKTVAGLAFTEITVRVDIAVAPEFRPRIEPLLESAKKHCIVSNALKTEVTVAARITTTP